MTAQDRKWQAESDARTIQRYGEIVNDSTRHNAAINHIKEEAENTLKALNIAEAAKQNYKDMGLI